ncbi:hypothetical protein LguiA_036492 [Lonicera macranthoides]
MLDHCCKSTSGSFIRAKPSYPFSLVGSFKNFILHEFVNRKGGPLPSLFMLGKLGLRPPSVYRTCFE